MVNISTVSDMTRSAAGREFQALHVDCKVSDTNNSKIMTMSSCCFVQASSVFGTVVTTQRTSS